MNKKISHLKKIADIPLITKHVIMSFTTPNASGLRVNNDFLYYKAHTLEAFTLSTILPYCVIVDLVDSVYQAYLQSN